MLDGNTNSAKNLVTTVETHKWIKRYARWRLLAVVLILFLIGQLILSLRERPVSTDYVARLYIKNEIVDMAQVRKAYKLLDDPLVKGVLVIVNSPGGLPAVSEAWAMLFDKLQKKNVLVVALAEDMCASGCYLAIMGSKKIFTYNSSIVGSIGAIMAYPNIYNIMKKLDIHFNVVKSGLLKAEPNVYSEPRVEYNEETQKMVSGVGSWFVAQVVRSRGIHDDKVVDTIAQGGVFTAEAAQKLHLIDAIGDELDVMQYMRTELKDEKIAFQDIELEEAAWFTDLIQTYGFKAQVMAWSRPYLSLSL